MRAIIYRRLANGQFPSVGMSDITITKDYKSLKSLIRYGIPSTWKVVKLELYHDNIYCEPFKTLIIGD